MGKVVKAVAGVVLIGLSIAFPALAPFLVPLGASLLLGAAAEALSPTPDLTQSTIAEQGLRLQLSVDPTAPRWICYGNGATGGNLIYRETFWTG